MKANTPSIPVVIIEMNNSCWNCRIEQDATGAMLNNVEQHMTGHHLWPTSKISTKLIFLIVLTDQTTVPLHRAVLTSHLKCFCSPPLLTRTTTFSQPPHVENYAATTNLDGQSRTDQAAQNAQAPIQGSNALGSAVTALSCANEFDAGSSLGGDGSIAASSITHPPLTTMTTFLQHQHAITRAAPTSPMTAATRPMSTTSVAATMHLTAAAAGLKHPYDPGGNYPNNENNDNYFVYDPGGDHLNNTSNSSCTNITHNTVACSLISTAHNNTLVPHYERVP